MRLLGHKMEAMITRLLGVILAALAAQFVIDGIERSFSCIAGPGHPATSGRGELARQRRLGVAASAGTWLQPPAQLHVEALRRFRHGRWSIPTGWGRSGHSRPGSAGPSHGHSRRRRARPACTSRIWRAVAVIGAGDRAVRRHSDQPRAEIDEGEHRAGRLPRHRAQRGEGRAAIVGDVHRPPVDCPASPGRAG